MAGEQSVHEANFVNQKKAEAHADQAGGNSQSGAEPRKPSTRESERKSQRSRNEHHSSDGSYSKDEQIKQRPLWVANRRQNQQRHSGGTRQAVNEPHNEGPQRVVQAQPAEVAVEPVDRSARGV